MATDWFEKTIIIIIGVVKHLLRPASQTQSLNPIVLDGVS